MRNGVRSCCVRGLSRNRGGYDGCVIKTPGIASKGPLTSFSSVSCELKDRAGSGLSDIACTLSCSPNAMQIEEVAMMVTSKSDEQQKSKPDQE
jgi:hypothetical protein